MSKRFCAVTVVLLFLTPAWSPAVDIPPDADHALEALEASPRHGEWIDIPLPDEDAPLKSWVVYPERPDNAPVVIVIHEIFGLTDWVRAVADQLAAEGYIAIAPDLLSGKGPGGGGTDSVNPDTVRGLVRSLTDDQRAARLDAVRDYAVNIPSATEALGVVGFCWGGSTSFLYATRQPELDAAVVYYGTAPRKGQQIDADALTHIEAPVLGLYGGNDQRVNATIPDTEAAMKRRGKSYEVHIYDGAGHGFLRAQDRMDGANKKAAEKAWGETLTFFQQHLES